MISHLQSASLRSWRDRERASGGAAIFPRGMGEFASGEGASEIQLDSPLAFTASLPKPKHSRAKSRQLRRLADGK